MHYDPLYYILAIVVLCLLNLAYSNWRLLQMGKFVRELYPEQYQKTLQPGQWPNRPFPFNVRGIKHSGFGLLKVQAEKIGKIGSETHNEKLILFAQNFYRNLLIRGFVLLILIVIIYFIK